MFSLKSVAMYQEQTLWKGTVYADSPGLEVYTIQMKTDVHLNLAIKQRIYETDKSIKIISINHQYLVWGTGFLFSLKILQETAKVLCLKSTAKSSPAGPPSSACHSSQNCP